MTRLMRTLPWVLCVALAAIAILSWVSRPAKLAAPIAMETTRPNAADERGQSLALLKVCSERLAQQAASPQRGSPPTPSAESCFALPEVQRRLAQAASSDPARSAGAGPKDAAPGPPPAQNPPALSAPEERFNRRFLAEVINVGEGETKRLRDYVCSVHALRTQWSKDLDSLLSPEASPNPATVQALVDSARSEREATLSDLKGMLGEDRYARLRALGGLSLLAKSFRCADRSPLD
jgi:hypothetical protein